MGEEERRLACEYVNLMYSFLRLGFSDPQEKEAESNEEKIQIIERMLNRFIEHDRKLSDLLQLYQEINALRRKAFKEAAEHMISIKALCDRELPAEMKNLFLKESEAKLNETLRICERINQLIKQAKQSENAKTASELIEYIENNHQVMEERLETAIELLKTARNELEKLKKDKT